MPVSGTQIAKLLPGRKPCRECGFPTCFAFAMKLALGGTTLDKCPYLAPEIRTKLEEMLSPLMKLITIGKGGTKLEIGNEEVVYRHEKTYLHPPGIALLISDKEDDLKVEDKLRKMNELKFPWIGLTLKADLLALLFESANPPKYLSLVKKVCDKTDPPIILMSEDMGVLFAARDICHDRNPLLYPITRDNIESAIPKIKDRPTPVVVRADGVEGLVPLTLRLREEGIEQVVLDPGSRSLLDAIRDQTLIRRAAIRHEFRPLGYPTIAFPCFMAKDKLREALIASALINKFAGIIVLSDLKKELLFPLLVQRLNIYTDPRFPMAVEPKVYRVGEPDENSPVLVTTNWALTYFLVSTQIEASKVPAWLVATNSEGLGALTAWAAGKFNGEVIAKAIKDNNLEDKVRHRKLVIPGKVAMIKGETEEALEFKWEVAVGPREASAIPSFLPDFSKALKGG